MSSRRRARPRLVALLAAIIVVGVVAFAAAIPWLKQQPHDVVFLLTGITATMVVLASFLLQVLWDKRLDEWERSNSRFSSYWGWAGATSLVGLLLAFPAFHDVIMHWAAVFGDTPNPDRRLVLVTFTFGFGAVVLTQVVFMALLSFAWTFWKSRGARETA